MLEGQYIKPEARCKDSGVQESTSQVSFEEVRPAGLPMDLGGGSPLGLSGLRRPQGCLALRRRHLLLHCQC